MNDDTNNQQQHLSITDSNHSSDITILNDDTDLVIAKQLFQAYCNYTHTIDEMSSILLSSISPLPEVTPPSCPSTPSTSTSAPSTSTTFNITIKSIIALFIELRSQYIGTIDNGITTHNNHNTNNTPTTIPNNFSTNDIVFNYSLFHASLLTNSPIIIDAVMPYINYDFTTLDIPLDQLDRIKKMNTLSYHEDEIYPTNFILQAIVDAARKGHYQSILHLINNYQLSPTIPICEVYTYDSLHCTDLLYYATITNKNLPLIEYLFPLCFESTNQKVLSQLILNIAQYGYLHLIKQFHNEYGINLSQLQDRNNKNILHYAVQSNNTELIDYLIEDIGLSVNEPDILQFAIDLYKWDNVKHLITKYETDLKLVNCVFHRVADDPNLTPDIIDYIITTFGINTNDFPTQTDLTPYSPIYSFAENCNVTAMKHLIEKYNADPHCLSKERDGQCNSLLYIALEYKYNIKSAQLLEMVEYLCELGLDVNHVGKGDKTPIELLVHSRHQSDESRLSIYQLLLEHGAVIGNVDRFIERALSNNHLSIIQHLIETHQPPIDVNNIKLSSKIPLFHHVLRHHPSIEFITYLLSLNTIDINQPDAKAKTPILHAMLSGDLNIDIIKLLVQSGAQVTIDDWLKIFGELSYRSKQYQFFQLLDYLKDTFGFSIQTLPPNHSQSHLTPLLQFSFNQLKFRYSKIKYLKRHFNTVIAYRALIHHYKASINDQDTITNSNNTVFHDLARFNHYELIQFTLLHSHYKPNIYLVNTKGETFLHILVSNCDRWGVNKDDERQRKDAQQSTLSRLDGIPRNQNNPDFQLIITDGELNDRHDNFAKVLDCIIDFL